MSDTCADLDARYMIALDGPQHAGEHLFVHNRALRRGSAQDTARLMRGEPVDPQAIYFRCVPTFEVSSESLRWMTENVFIGTGARFTDRVEMRFFRPSGTQAAGRSGYAAASVPPRCHRGARRRCS